jgi:thioredoxin 2
MNDASATAAETVLVACPDCHALVRVPSARLGEHPKCSSCKSEILGHAPTALDEQSFTAHITRAELPVLVDFWAPWCGPCRMMAPVLDGAAPQYATRLQIGKVNTDEQPRIAERFGIRSIPTLILFHHGKEIARQSGALDGARLARFIDGALPH